MMQSDMYSEKYIISTQRSQNISEWLLFIYLIVLIIDTIVDLHFFCTLISLGIVLVDVYFVQGGIFRIPRIKRYRGAVRVYLFFLIYNVIITFLSAIIFGVAFLMDGIPILVNPIIVFFVVLYFSYYIQWDSFVIRVRDFGLIVSFVGAVESLLKRPFFPTTKEWTSAISRSIGTDSFRSYTVFVHPIVNAFFLLLILSILAMNPIKNRFLNAAAAIIVIYAIIGAGTRSGWISLFFLLVVFSTQMIINQKMISINSALRGLIMFLLLGCSVLLLREDIIQLLTRMHSLLLRAFLPGSSDLSRRHRLGMIYNAVLYFRDNPACLVFGRGVHFGVQFSKENALSDSWSIVDNQYITFLLNTGMIGVGLFVSIIFISIRNALRKSRNVQAVTSAIAFCVIYLEYFFFEGNQWKICMFFFTCIVFLAELGGIIEEHKEIETRRW